jgi:hypothetical protein
VTPPRQTVRILVGLACSALATVAGMFLPFILHGIRNLPWEIVFGSAFYVTWFFRSVLGERLEYLIGGFLWPGAVIALVCCCSDLYRQSVRSADITVPFHRVFVGLCPVRYRERACHAHTIIPQRVLCTLLNDLTNRCSEPLAAPMPRTRL